MVAQPAASGNGSAAGARVVGIVVGAGWSQRAAAPVARLAKLDDDVSFIDAASGQAAVKAVLIIGRNGAR